MASSPCPSRTPVLQQPSMSYPSRIPILDSLPYSPRPPSTRGSEYPSWDHLTGGPHVIVFIQSPAHVLHVYVISRCLYDFFMSKPMIRGLSNDESGYLTIIDSRYQDAGGN